MSWVKAHVADEFETYPAARGLDLLAGVVRFEFETSSGMVRVYTEPGQHQNVAKAMKAMPEFREVKVRMTL